MKLRKAKKQKARVGLANAFDRRLQEELAVYLDYWLDGEAAADEGTPEETE